MVFDMFFYISGRKQFIQVEFNSNNIYFVHKLVFNHDISMFTGIWKSRERDNWSRNNELVENIGFCKTITEKDLNLYHIRHIQLNSRMHVYEHIEIKRHLKISSFLYLTDNCGKKTYQYFGCCWKPFFTHSKEESFFDEENFSSCSKLFYAWSHQRISWKYWYVSEPGVINSINRI